MDENLKYHIGHIRFNLHKASAGFNDIFHIFYAKAVGTGIFLRGGVGVTTLLNSSAKTVFTNNRAPVQIYSCGDMDVFMKTILQQSVCFHSIVGNVSEYAAEIQIAKRQFKWEYSCCFQENSVFLGCELRWPALTDCWKIPYMCQTGSTVQSQSARESLKVPLCSLFPA